jgi:enoyl-CoA hydratase
VEKREFQHWQLEREGGVLWARHSNPPRETLNARGVLELASIAAEVEADRSVRVLGLRGPGAGVFIAHYEVGELAASAEAQTAHKPPEAAPADRAQARELHPFHQLCLKLEALDAITLAVLDGNAAGGGFELALACDFRLARSGDARFGLPETHVGIIPGAGGTQRMVRLLGVARSLDLILHGTLVGPDEAHSLGLVHRVFAATGFEDSVRAFAATLAGRAPIALAQAKHAIRRGSQQSLEAGLALEQAGFERCMRSRDAAGALCAFLSGKPYAWQGE